MMQTNLKKNLIISLRMTIATTILLGIAYPLIVTGLAQALFHQQANGELIQSHGQIVGSRLIGQPFTSAGYFHSRPSSAGNGYDAVNSGASNLGPTNHALIDRVTSSVLGLREESAGRSIPVDLVTASGSGLDPHITPAAAEFQIPRVAWARGISEAKLGELVIKHTEGRQLGFLGEPRVNVLELNLDLDATHN